MMPDAKKIAEMALARAEEIKNRARLRKKRMQAAAAVAGVCACTLVFTLARSLHSPIATGPEEDGIIIAESQVPLAGFPFLLAEPVFVMPDLSGGVSSGEGAELDILLINPEENVCYLTFEIVLTDTGESVYKSHMVGPNMRIERVALSGTLEKGSHKAALLVRAYDLDGFAEIGTERSEFDLFS